MPYNRTTARKLLTSSEYELFEASLAEDLKALPAARLRTKIKRARTLRDKYQDLLRRQKVATRGRAGTKVGKTGVANVRTEQKQRVFAEALQRFEKRLERVEADQVRAERQAAKNKAQDQLAGKRSAQSQQLKARQRRVSPKAPAKPRKARGSKVGPTSESARQARHAMQFQSARTKPIQAHVRASGRRAQARRNTRG